MTSLSCERQPDRQTDRPMSLYPLNTVRKKFIPQLGLS